MFGYVVVNKPELKIREYNRYKSYYCGLCDTLTDNYGLSSGLCLSYDGVFLLMLLNGLYEPKNLKRRKICLMHPASHCHIITNDFSLYVADMLVVFAKHKCTDDWLDDRKYAKKLYGSLLSPQYKKIKARYPQKVSTIEAMMHRFSMAEKNNETNIDIISGLFGNAFGEVFAVYNDNWSDTLRNIGLFLGKFIYIMDAYDDIEKDMASGNYNPFSKVYKDADFDDNVKNMLIINASKCANEFEKLPILRDSSILSNILYSGIMCRYEIIKKRKDNSHE